MLTDSGAKKLLDHAMPIETLFCCLLCDVLPIPPLFYYHTPRKCG